MIPNLAIRDNYSTLGSVDQAKIWSAYKGLAKFSQIGRVWVGAAGVENNRSRNRPWSIVSRKRFKFFVSTLQKL